MNKARVGCVWEGAGGGGGGGGIHACACTL